MGLCADEVPSSTSDADAWWDFTHCLMRDALSTLADPDKAVTAALSLYQAVPIEDVQAMGRALDSASSHLKMLGTIMSIASKAFVLRDIYQQIPDALSQMGDDRPGDVLWTLDANQTRPELIRPFHVFHREQTFEEYDQTYQPGLVAIQDGDRIALTWLSVFHRPCFDGTWDGRAYAGTYSDLQPFQARALPYVASDGSVRLRVWADGTLYSGTDDEDWTSSDLETVRALGAEMPDGPLESDLCQIQPG